MSSLLPGLLVGVAVLTFVLPVLLRLRLLVLLMLVRVLQVAADSGAADVVVLAKRLRGEHADVAFLLQTELQTRMAP